MSKPRIPQGTDKQSLKKRGPVRRKPQPMVLEPRWMFDGAALSHEAELPAHAPAQEMQPAERETEREGATSVSTPPAQEIAFIDTSVADWQVLADNLRADVEKVLLDPAQDAITQIADSLAGRSELDAIHIISHGDSGALVLAGHRYGIDSLPQYQQELSVIGSSLAAEGDILLYGCDIAQGSAGAAFLDAISTSTGADINASTDTTGQGGNWELEYRSGQIDATSVFDRDVENYAHVLGTENFSINVNQTFVRPLGAGASFTSVNAGTSGSNTVAYNTDHYGERLRLLRH